MCDITVLIVILLSAGWCLLWARCAVVLSRLPCACRCRPGWFSVVGLGVGRRVATWIIVVVGLR